MLPTSKTSRSLTRRTPAGHTSVGPALPIEGALPGPVEDALPGPADPLRPIGPERLRALREAIRKGTYPSPADILGGVERLLDVS